MDTALTSRVQQLLAALNLAPSKRPPFLVRRYRYRDADQMRAMLGPDLSADTVWQATDGPYPPGKLAAIFEATENTERWLHHLPVYRKALSSYRDRPVRLLEIGVGGGGSLQMWRRYLDPGSVIVGIDVDARCSRFDDPTNRTHVRIGAQQDSSFLRGVANEFGPFDVIIDDGSHMTSHMVESFRFLFANALSAGGIYIAEDIHSNYWPTHRDSRLSFVEFTKWLIDAMHAHYLQTNSELEFRPGSPERRKEVTVPVATVLIESIEVSDSIAVIRRSEGRRELPRSVKR